MKETYRKQWKQRKNDDTSDSSDSSDHEAAARKQKRLKRLKTTDPRLSTVDRLPKSTLTEGEKREEQKTLTREASESSRLDHAEARVLRQGTSVKPEILDGISHSLR